MSTPIIEHMEVYPSLNFKQFSTPELKTAAEKLENQAETTDSEPLQYVYKRMARTIRGIIIKRKSLTQIKKLKGDTQ